MMTFKVSQSEADALHEACKEAEERRKRNET